MKPPELVSRQRIFDGKVFDVERDRVRFEDGREVDLDIVRHPPSIVLIPMPAADQVILVRQYRHAIGRWIWELPAGTTDAGEAIDAAAARECHEEIGLLPGRLTRLGTMVPTPGFCDEEMTFYLAEDLGTPAHHAAHDEDEQLEPKTFTLTELEAMARRGEIEDMKTVAGLELLRRARARERRGAPGPRERPS